jgi:hypothetical protein
VVKFQILNISQNTKTAIADKNAVSKNLRAADILKPKSETRFFQNTVDDQNAKAAKKAKRAALLSIFIFQISFQSAPYAIIYAENIAITAKK